MAAYVISDEVTGIGRLGIRRSARLLALLPVWLACLARAEETVVAPLVKAPSDLAPSAQDCKNIADRLTAAFPGSVSSVYEPPYSIPTSDGKYRRDTRWIVTLPEDHTIRVLCLRKSIGLSLAATGSVKATVERLTIADRSAEIFSGMKVENGAASCLRLAKPIQKRAGKVGRAHVREINQIPHFEGETKRDLLTISCSYDYNAKQPLVIDYDLPEGL